MRVFLLYACLLGWLPSCISRPTPIVDDDLAHVLLNETWVHHSARLCTMLHPISTPEYCCNRLLPIVVELEKEQILTSPVTGSRGYLVTPSFLLTDPVAFSAAKRVVVWNPFVGPGTELFQRELGKVLQVSNNCL